MKFIKKILTLALGGLFALPSWGNEHTTIPQSAGVAMMRLQTNLFSRAQDRFQDSDIWEHLRNDFRLDEVNAQLVRTHETKFSTNQAYFNRTINRSTPYMYHIMSEVQKRDMPAEIALLPFIESAFVTKARSRVGASGLWQFMPATGRHYGLEQTPFYDGRHDIYAATNAALNYLEYLYGLFGDWSLALAAYNWGEGNVSRAIKKAQEKGLPPTYENLKMPAETRHYVPKLLAVRNLVNNPQAFGLKLPSVANQPYFKAVEVKEPIDIMAAAFLANIPKSEFLALNPAFKTPVFIPKSNHRRMLLPIQAAKTFEQNYRTADGKTLLSWDVYTPTERMDLNTLAMQTGTSVSELKRLNGLTGNSVKAGRTLLLNKNSAALVKNNSSPWQLIQADIDNTPDTFVEQTPVLTEQQMTAFKTAQQTAANTQPENQEPKIALSKTTQPENYSLQVQPNNTNTKEDALLSLIQSPTESPQSPSISSTVSVTAVQSSPNQEKAIVQAQKPQTKPANNRTIPHDNKNTKNQIKTTTYQVRSGESLFSIAQKNDTTVEALMALNQLNHHHIHAGQTLKIAQNTLQTRTEKSNKKAKQHKVQSGETLYSIAKQYGLKVADLSEANQLKSSSLKVGQLLTINAAANKQVSKNKKANVPKEKIPAVYQVKKGDTLDSIAKRYKLKVNDLKRLNKNSKVIKVGQKLRLL